MFKIKKTTLIMMLSLFAVILTSCHVGSSMSQQNALNSVSTQQNIVLPESSGDTYVRESATKLAWLQQQNCFVPSINQTESNGNLFTNIVLQNKCDYNVILSGKNISFISQNQDGTPVVPSALTYNYVNSNGSNRTYTLNLSAAGTLCSGESSQFNLVSGTFDALSIKAGGSVVLNSSTPLASGAIYNTLLAKASFNYLPTGQKTPSSLGLILSDADLANVSGSDSLSNLPSGPGIFALKTILVTNLSCNTLESVSVTNVLPTGFSLDNFRTTCINQVESLASGQSCKYVLRSDPPAQAPTTQLKQFGESRVFVSATATDVTTNNLVSSNTKSAPFSYRVSMPSGTTYASGISVKDNSPNAFNNVVVGGLGVKTITVTNATGMPLDTVTFKLSPSGANLPADIDLDASSSCVIGGSQKLASGSSCNIILRYAPKFQNSVESFYFRVYAFASNDFSGAQTYISSTYLYSASSANSGAYVSGTYILGNTLGGLDVDNNPAVSFTNSINNIPVGSFGLVAFMIINNTGEPIYNVDILDKTIFSTNPEFTMDNRTTCGFVNYSVLDSKIALGSGRNCLLVFKYSPALPHQIFNYSLNIYGVNAAGQAFISNLNNVAGSSR